jgi:hypothetical protein
MLSKVSYIVYFFAVQIFLVQNLNAEELHHIDTNNRSMLLEHYNEYTQNSPDFEREDRIIGEIEESVMDGDVEYLSLADDKEVFSIYTESELDEVKGGVIVLHSRGYHANWSSVIKPVRVGLSQMGWSTLSVQMPVLEKDAKYYDYVPIFPYAHERIRSAIEFLREQDISNIVIVAHGCGAHMSMSYIDKYGDSELSAYVGIGIGATDYKQKIIKPFPLSRIKSPILDIFGEKDFPGVLRLAKHRKPLLNNGNTNNLQLSIKNADHYYKDGDTVDLLVKEIANWLDNIN